MDITFDAPHVLQSGSLLDEAAKPIMKRCLRKLRQVCPRATIYRSGPTQCTWSLPTVFNAGSVPVENAEAIQALLGCLTELDMLYRVQTGEPDFERSVPDLYESGVYYDRTEVWDTTPALYARGYGDCKSLACSLAAERRLEGESCKTVFRYLPHRSGPLHVTYHILNLTPQGWEDPSKVCGMTDNENAYFNVKPQRRGYQMAA